MVALKTFSVGGAKLTFQGEEFEVDSSRKDEYIRLGLAKPLEGTAIPSGVDLKEEELQEKTMKELKEIAKNIGVSSYSGLTKSELIFAIRGQQNKNRGGF
jgi:Rho termination factor, N-terminal domain